MKVKFIGNHIFYKTGFKKDRQLTPEEKKKYIHCYIKDGETAEVTELTDKVIKAKYTELETGKIKHIMICRHCFGDKVELLEE